MTNTRVSFVAHLVLIIMLVSFLFRSSSAPSSDLQLDTFLTLSSSCWSTCLWLATVRRSLSAISRRASPRILSDCWRDWSELQIYLRLWYYRFCHLWPVVMEDIRVCPLRWWKLTKSSVCLRGAIYGAWPGAWLWITLTFNNYKFP